MKVKLNLEFKFVVSLIFAVLVAIFAIQNAGAVEIRFFFKQFTISQAIIILLSSVVGAIIVFLLGLVNQIKQNLKIKQIEKELEILISERDDLQSRFEGLEIENTGENQFKNSDGEPSVTEEKGGQSDQDLQNDDI